MFHILSQQTYTPTALAIMLAGNQFWQFGLLQVWRNNRAAPPVVSLACIYTDKMLVQCLQACLTFQNHKHDQLALSAASLLCELQQRIDHPACDLVWQVWVSVGCAKAYVSKAPGL